MKKKKGKKYAVCKTAPSQPKAGKARLYIAKRPTVFFSNGVAGFPPAPPKGKKA